MSVKNLTLNLEKFCSISGFSMVETLTLQHGSCNYGTLPNPKQNLKLNLPWRFGRFDAD
jgi:hypothetical protein